MLRWGDNFTRVDVEIFLDINFISLMDNSFLNSICYISFDSLKYLFHRLFYIFVINLTTEIDKRGGEGECKNAIFTNYDELNYGC